MKVIDSKERVKNAIHFRGVDRIPINFNIAQPLTPQANHYDDDIIWAVLDADPEFVPEMNNETYYENEWHTVFKRLTTSIGEPYRVPIDSIDKIKQYQIPDLGAEYRFESTKRTRAEYPDKYLLGTLGGDDTGAMLFMRLLDLFGFEDCMINLAMYPDEVEELISRITDMHIKSIEGFAKAGADGVIAGDDLGLQNMMIISPDMWRSMFKPYYAKIIEAAHHYRMDMMLHICGHIAEIIDDLIEIGLDVLQIDQQDHMDIDMLSERFGGKIAFFCPTDIQTTLITSDLLKIENKAKQLIDGLGSEKGGFIAKMYPQPASIGIVQESIDAMCDAFIRYGQYNKNDK